MLNRSLFNSGLFSRFKHVLHFHVRHFQRPRFNKNGIELFVLLRLRRKTTMSLSKDMLHVKHKTFEKCFANQLIISHATASKTYLTICFFFLSFIVD